LPDIGIGGYGSGIRRDDEKFFRSSTLNFSNPPGIVIPHRRTALMIAVSCPVRGRFSRALSKWDRAKAWPGRGNPSRPDAAPAAVACTHGLGRPWVSVRPHYGGLPPKLAGRGQASGAKSPRVATSPEARTRVLRRRGGAPRGVAVCLCFPAIREIRRGVLQCAFRRSASPHKRGGKLKAHLARRRENAEPCPYAWLVTVSQP
jgi:hypothetical protein